MPRQPKLRKKKTGTTTYWFTAAGGDTYFGNVASVSFTEARNLFNDHIQSLSENQEGSKRKGLTASDLVELFLTWIEKNRSRIKKPTCTPVLKLPALPYEQFVALRDNIAVNGVLVPILVDSDGPRREIIDGNYRKAIADELGYDCPEIVHPNLSDDEKRTLARALNLARRQLNREQKRQLVADQLEETPDRSNRWIGKQLGVHHSTVATERARCKQLDKLSSWSERWARTERPGQRRSRPKSFTDHPQSARPESRRPHFIMVIAGRR